MTGKMGWDPIISGWIYIREKTRKARRNGAAAKMNEEEKKI